MSETKHTPGPWEPRLQHGYYAINAVPVGWVATTISIGELSEAATVANARLIAAAPDLLEAAREAIRDIEIDCPEWLGHIKTLRAAISKAEG